jgi:GT2 family glycosyltransferase
MKKILIAVPCMDMVSARFAQSLATLKKVGQSTVSFLIGSLVYDSRNTLAAYAVQMEADYILWLDSDMVFPPDTLERMMKVLDEHKEIDILSGLFFRRTTPFTPVLFSKLEREGDNVVFEEFDHVPEGLTEIAGCGFGCVLMRTDCLLDIASRQGTGAWFTPMLHAGEDCSFCLRARECGYSIWVDPSIECGHMGYAAVTRNFFEASKGDLE